ncbi:MAG: hypothetical protein RR537_06405 [Longicatena sp.]
MNIKKLIIVSIVSIMSCVPIYAKENKNILLVSEGLPYVILVEIKDDTHMNVNFIPTKLQLPLSCASQYISPINSLSMEKQLPCIKKSIASYFHVSIQHTLYIHMDNLANDTHLPYTVSSFQQIGNITDYFQSVVEKMDISMLLHYQNYISSSLSLHDYYNYYNLFKKNKIIIKYGFVNQLYFDDNIYPMDASFHLQKNKD